jgi:glycosyltransferase involved in cell wall biosynthesis
MLSGATVTASLVITTKNRQEELRAALCSAFRQSMCPEILVLDDGSIDGTAQMVHAEFPRATLYRFEESGGLVVRRNEGARLARGKIILSMDDDAVFSSPDVISQTLASFNHPRVGAVTIPYIDVRKSPEVRQRAPSIQGTYITDTYIGTAHAVRRDIFLQLGGYRETLVHQGEEPDYCIRMLMAGYVVRLGNADPIHHFESTKRDFQRMDFYGARNSALFAWQNVPMPFFPLHLLATCINCLLLTLKPIRFFTRLRGVLSAYFKCLSTSREPVPIPAYRLHRRLKKSGPFLICDIEDYLPEMQRLFTGSAARLRS